MIKIVMLADCPIGQAIGVKESLAMDVEEKYKDVRVISVEEILPEQKEFEGFGKLEE